MNMEKPQTECHFSWEMQARFAELSLDYNPMHMDAMAARRTQAGAPVVHGIHALLWALDYLAKTHVTFHQISTLKVSFYKWIYVDTLAHLFVVASTEKELKAQIRVGSTVVISLSLLLDPAQSVVARPEETSYSLNDSATFNFSTVPFDVPFEDIEKESGSVDLSLPALCELFPHLSKALHWRRVASLGTLSRIVGMYCPGLNSIFSGLALKFHAERPGSEKVDFRVQSVIKRYRLAKLAVEGPGLSGIIEAFVRLPPTLQISIEQAARNVNRGEFSGTHALVVGGSRGLGETTAKLIAAGGGAVTITYAVGRDQALAVAREIEQWGGRCQVIPYDAALPCSPQLMDVAGFSHVYYYATGQIFRVKQTLFSSAVFQDFTKIYVDAFYDLCQTLAQRSTGTMSVFYPSSIAITDRQRDMTEYAMAKAAGETLCEDMNRFTKHLRIIHKRLPRLATDQTLSVIPVPCADPLEILLPLIREMQGTREPVVPS